MHGMNGRERCHAPARMACVTLLSCALAACGGGGGSSVNFGSASAVAGSDTALTILTIAAGAGGWVRAATVGGAVVAEIGADAPETFVYSVDSAATLTAIPATGYRFAGWALSPQGLACAHETETNPCELPVGSVTTDAAVLATFEAVPSTLTVGAGANGSVRATVAGAGAAAIDADSSQSFAFSVEATATLTAVPAGGYEFAGWMLSPSWLTCKGREQHNPCALDAGSVIVSVTVSATFEAVPTMLTVAAEAGGSVQAEVTGAGAVTVASDVSHSLAFSVLSAATLTAVAADGYRFAGWTSPDGLACARETETKPCELPVGSVTADAMVSAAFEAVPSTLTVTAGAGGSVQAAVAGAGAVTIGADSSQSFAFSVEAAAMLTAAPADGYRFAGWTLPGGLKCASGTDFNICELPTGSVTSDTSVSVAFQLLGPPGSWRGPGSVSQDGATRAAAPYAPGAFERWEGTPCDGSKELACDLSSVMASRALSTALFRPFVVDGIKSLAFGLGYYGTAPDHFRVSFQSGPDAGFTPVLGLESLSSGPARLTVSAHLLPWGLGGYLTEACDAQDSCVEADGGRWILEQPDSVAAIGYFKAPNADVRDQFGHAVALSADGATLAVGAEYEASARSGVFAPDDNGYQAALDSDGATQSGAVYVYRLSGSEWSLEAFVKGPAFGASDRFGRSLALSADGATLAVGMRNNASSHTGVFAPDDNGYQAALASYGASHSGAAAVYRRSGSAWSIEVFVKAPKISFSNDFGEAIALSADGATLAVGAPLDSSSHTGALAPNDNGYQAALASEGALRSALRSGPYNAAAYASLHSGAAYVYHRSDIGRWGIAAFVKAPKTGRGDDFGATLALSGDGATLAVGAPREASASSGTFAPGDTGYQAALDSDDLPDSGAVTVYRRSGSAWSIEAFVKAPKAGFRNDFGEALALSPDGSILVVGAPGEGSAATGVFAPTDAGYQAALDSRGGGGGAYVYRRSDAAWSVEAFVKVPVAGAGGAFGADLALSDDGSTLVVGAPGESSAATGVFAPTDAGYQAALDSGGAFISGGVTVYRRSNSRWRPEAFVKAPNTGANDNFGGALALSDDGSTLAVGAPGEDGGALTRPVSGNFADVGNSTHTSGAVYLY